MTDTLDDAPKPRAALSRERIELAALELIEQEGLAGFSTRKLSRDLGCEAMSIYHYFPSKGHLMDALVDRVVGELTVMAPSESPWRQRVADSLRELRAVALKYPNFYGFWALHRLNTPTGLRYLNGILRFMLSLGLPEEEAVRLFRAIGYYVSGAALEETAGYSKGHTTAEPVPDDVVVRDYPFVAVAGKYFRPSGFDKTFELGLEIMLDGIEARIAAARRGRAHPSAAGT